MFCLISILMSNSFKNMGDISNAWTHEVPILL